MHYRAWFIKRFFNQNWRKLQPVPWFQRLHVGINRRRTNAMWFSDNTVIATKQKARSWVNLQKSSTFMHFLHIQPVVFLDPLRAEFSFIFWVASKRVTFWRIAARSFSRPENLEFGFHLIWPFHYSLVFKVHHVKKFKSLLWGVWELSLFYTLICSFHFVRQFRRYFQGSGNSRGVKFLLLNNSSAPCKYAVALRVVW